MDQDELSGVFGMSLYRRVWDTARMRLGLEERWYYDTLQYLGIYDEETQSKLNADQGSSKLFVNQTRPKVRTLVARLNDMLFPTDEANWDISPTPVPRFERALARRRVATDEQLPLQQAEVQNAEQMMDQAKEAARNMQRLMKDQLVESKYVDAGRKAIKQACKLGAGVVKGPFEDTRRRRNWVKQGDDWAPKMSRDMRPRFRFVDLWDFYVDMDAESMEDAEFVFQLHRISGKAMKAMARNGTFNAKAVRYLIDATPDYAPSDIGHFVQNLRFIKQLENESSEDTLNRYLVFQYYGPLTFEEFAALCKHFDRPKMLETFKPQILGKEGDKEDPLATINAMVWFSSDQVLEFDVNPLESGALPFSVFRLDPTENTLIGGPGLPRMLRDPQRSLNAAWRMAIESAGLSGIPMFIIDRSRVTPTKGGTFEIRPRQIFESLTGFGPQEGGPPIVPVPIAGPLGDLLALSRESRQFMDDESNLPMVAQGEQGSGAKQTAHGMTLLANAANTLFRDAARGFDGDITVPNMTRLYEWNMEFSDDEAVKGDMEIKALGSSVLLINEILSQNLMMLMNTAAGNPEMFASLKFEEMLRLWFKSMRLERYGLIKSDDEIEKMRQEAANAPPPPDPQAETKIAVAEMQLNGEMQRLQMEREVAVLKLASQENLTVAQIESSLEKVRMQTQAKERTFLAEAGLKERHGTGV